MLDRLLDAKLSDMEELLNEYVNGGYSVIYLLENFNLFSSQKKKMLIERFYSHYNYKFNEIITKNKDIVLIIEYLFDNGTYTDIYNYTLKLKDPKKYLKKEHLDEIVTIISTGVLVQDFGIYFKEEIIKTKVDCYELLIIKEKLSKEEIIEIYKKTFNSYKNIFENYLNNDERREYTKIFLSENSDMYFIAEFLIKEKAYDEEDFDKLILLIGAFAPASSIYNILMNEKLSDLQRIILEKSLYDTKDIEYIAYYTFYKNKEEFKRIFKGTILFLGFVMLYEHLFENKKVLKGIIEEIEKENVNYVDNITNKINTSYELKKGK